jgi:hypothetical protein
LSLQHKSIADHEPEASSEASTSLFGASGSSNTSAAARASEVRAARASAKGGTAATHGKVLDGGVKSDADPGWTGREVGLVQKELARIGLYHLRVDQDLGSGTEAGLVDAFGDDSWRTMSASDVVSRLKAVATPKSKDKNFHYGQMFKDGLLDITLGVGFDEHDNHLSAINGFQQVLGARGFTVDPGLAAQMYQEAGRSVGPSAFGQFYVKQKVLEYTPPVGGPPRPIHAVVRLVFSRDGSRGGKAAGAFKQGMSQSDVAYYSGHGRYGSGPDFDRNMSFELLDADGNTERAIADYEVLQRELRKEGKPLGRGPWQQFMWRARHDRIKVHGSNEGNVFVNPKNLHGGEFGAKLMYWNLKRQGKEGAELTTGKEGTIDKGLDEPAARDYRVLVFDGCRTRDYVTSVRRTPGLGRNDADVLATTRTVNWGDEVNTLAVFLDGIIGQTSKKDVVQGMDKQQSDGHKDTYQDF